MKTFLFALLGVLASLNAIGQELKSGNLWLQHQSFTSSIKPTVVYVQGDLEELFNYLPTVNGTFRHSFRSYHSVILPCNQIASLVSQPFVKQVQIEGGTGTPLVNESRKNTSADKPIVYKGDTLPAYTGKGVIMGIIDTGIDFTHPDFKTKNGKTRILKIWDQTLNNDSTKRPHYGYGEVYDSTSINDSTCPHKDPNPYWGHGTMVSGIAAGNGNSVPDSIGDYRGYATESNMLVVASNFAANNWTQTVADAVDWIYSEADKAGLPCVINISAGTYHGSHDGKDLAAQYIDSLVNAKAGRAIVSSAGNAGAHAPFHLNLRCVNDSVFSWFKVNPSTGFGGPAVFFEGWADTADFNKIRFSIGATDTANWSDTIYIEDSIKNRLNQTINTNLPNGARLTTYAELRGDRYLLQVLITNPNNKFYYRFGIKGSGLMDFWSGQWLGGSDIISSQLPSAAQYPNINRFTPPDSVQSIVSSWNCHPNTLSVGNYNNRKEYENVDGNMRQTVDLPVGGIGRTSSQGPNRNNIMKPEVAAPGNFTVTSGRIADVTLLAQITSQRYKLAKGGFHFSNGGTSMAAPVVSGIAAMLLEKCPQMTQQDIRKAIIASAYGDQHTNRLPNFKFGNGKVNAQKALENTHIYDTIISSTGNYWFCEGDSLSVSLSNNYTLTRWNTGSTTPFLKIDSTNFTMPYKAWFKSQNGCKGYTDSVKVDMKLNPSFSILGDSVFCLDKGDTLFASLNDSTVSWFWSTGDTTNFLPIDSAKTYTLTGTSMYQCSSTDTFMAKGKWCNVSLTEINNSTGLLIYPNPGRGVVNLESSQLMQQIDLYNSKGQLVLSKQVDSRSQSIDVSEVYEGVYLLKISTEGNLLVKQLMIRQN